MGSKTYINFQEEDLSKYDWIKLRKDMDTLLPTETFAEKFCRKFSENPFVPIGKYIYTSSKKINSSILLSHTIQCLSTFFSCRLQNFRNNSQDYFMK